ncbi:putative endopeptidase [Catalinimonas alkaloidigena]|uniref:Putative endopeptidase n=1 Tax=Catalinimonas alkaloidigena TaxID=1075417 RepID=A0A1G9MRH9_9BACT|nr:M13 family metallopeptidase [Catalinimonas alkaloidigena]SDL76902.1 putative endopeptidase [Catalinimonas alkaloidigena]
MLKKFCVLTSAVLLAASCTSEQPQDTTEETAIRGIDPTNLDTTVAPCDNFYRFANGGWLDRNPVPPSESRWSSFNELFEQNNAIMREILDSVSAKTDWEKGSVEQKVGDFYHSGMDTVQIAKLGLDPVRPELQKIASIQNRDDLQRVIAELHPLGVNAAFRFYVTQDDKISSQYIPNLIQGGLGLPDRDYYVRDDAPSQEIRDQYVDHLGRMMTLAGEPEAEALQHAKQIMALETRLAKASMERVKLRDPYATYNKMSVDELQRKAPNLNWKAMFQAMNVPDFDTLIVGQPDFVAELNRAVAQVSLDNWKAYLEWTVLNTAAPWLSDAFVEADFDFFSKTLNGTQEMRPRWKRIANATDDALGEALGELYVKRTFSPEAKEKALEMVHNLQEAFRERLGELTWMSDETKQAALEKLEAFATKIGYPDEWRDYSDLDIARDAYARNQFNANVFGWNRNVNKLGKPIDRKEWHMTPPTVNAYYNPSQNEIVFPAGILQPPFFDPKADDAVNYGGMGAVIGHEMTHGFDDQGRQYDPQGNLRDWWQASDADQFKGRAQRMVNQFGEYTMVDTIPVNGELTLGENIADLGGLKIAYAALQKALENKRPEKIDGFTPEQRFFLGWAQIWRTNITDQAAARLIKVDPHAPGMYRTNGPLANLPEFYEAWGCTPADAMMRNDSVRVEIW